MTTDTKAPPSHPCAYPREVLDAMQTHVNRTEPGCGSTVKVLDPMAGIGRIHDLHGCWTCGIELEPEWATQHDRNIVGDATNMWFFPDDSMDVIAVSPAYGNRLADQYLPPESDRSRRYTYATSLGRRCSDRSGAALQWGDAYRELHEAAWAESVRLLRPGGLFLLNAKNHVRRGEEQPVLEWHIATLIALGLSVVEDAVLGTDGIKHSPHRDRFPERLIVLENTQSLAPRATQGETE